MTGRTSTWAPLAPDEEPQIRRFNLQRWFMAVSLVAISLVSIISASLLSQFLTERMLALDAKVTTEFLNHVMNVEQSAAQPSTTETHLFKDDDEFFRHIGAMPDVFRANVYNHAGLIIWSTDPALIGVNFGNNAELEVSLAGEPEFALGSLEELTKAEHEHLIVPGGTFVENYLPIFDHGRVGGTVIASVEVYRVPRAVFAAIDAGKNLIYASAAAGGLFIIATLFWLIRRADRVMSRQETQIAEGERLATAGEMASAVAHGLRNPLASIRSSAELAMRLRSTERVHELLEDIVAQSDRLENWVRQYLSVTNVETTDHGATALRTVISQCFDTYGAEMARLRIHSIADLAADLPDIRIGSVVLEQVLNGVVANAIEAMPNGGTLTVTAARAGRDQLDVRFHDTGIGMTPDQLRAAFTPFRTSKRNGLGLGLALARRILARHGAGIDLTSVAGEGTVVSLRLPVTA